MRRVWPQVDPRHSVIPAILVFIAGLFMHSVDQALHVRAGPIPILVTAPTVATLVYLYGRPRTTGTQFGILLVWGAGGTGLAILGMYLHATTYELPRAMTGPEMLLYDLGPFLWFVVALTGAYAFSSRPLERDRYRVAAIIAGPILQLGWAVVVVGLVEVGGYG